MIPVVGAGEAEASEDAAAAADEATPGLLSVSTRIESITCITPFCPVVRAASAADIQELK